MLRNAEKCLEILGNFDPQKNFILDNNGAF